jgi:hypothetical protein
MGVRDQRVEFVVRASRGESLSSLCREYEISRPTGYLWLSRFGEHGRVPLVPRSWGPGIPRTPMREAPPPHRRCLADYFPTSCTLISEVFLQITVLARPLHAPVN